MANLIIGEFKDTLKNYFSKAEAINSKIEENLKKYSAEFAETENNKLKAQENESYMHAKNQINDIFINARDCLAYASISTVEELTGDRLLFDDSTGLDLSLDEVKLLVQKYKNNFTMLRLIKNWIEKHHTGMTDFATILHEIHLPADHIEVYRKFGNSAISLIESIHNGNLNPLFVQAYADEAFAKGLFDIIGDGMHLSDYKSRNIQPTVKQMYNDIKLNLGDKIIAC